MIRYDGQRKLLFDMDVALQQLLTEIPDHPATLRLTGIYHNLLRYWVNT